VGRGQRGSVWHEDVTTKYGKRERRLRPSVRLLLLIVTTVGWLAWGWWSLQFLL